MGDSMLGDPNTLLFPRTLLFTSQSHSFFSLGLVPLFSFVLSLELPTPIFSFYSLIYNLRWVEVSWLFLIISGNGGPIPTFLSGLSGCFVGNDGNGIETSSCHQKAVRQRHSLRQYRDAGTLYPAILLLGRTHFRHSKHSSPNMVFWFKPGVKVCSDRGH